MTDTNDTKIPPEHTSALAAAIEAAGGASRLAIALGVTVQAVSQWRQIPGNRVIATEAATGVSRRMLRPDLYPPEPSPKPSPRILKDLRG